jgi:cellulose 1,4-beta-cellobiosidase
VYKKGVPRTRRRVLYLGQLVVVASRANKMHFSSLLLALTTAGAVTAAPKKFRSWNETTANPFEGKKLFANPTWAQKLEETYNAFKEAGDATNAGKVRTIQKTGTFVWVTDRAGLKNIDAAIEAARSEQKRSGVEQIVGLVLYNLPDRDCSAGESAGELSSDKGGLDIYKNEFIKPYAEKVGAAKDLTFAIVLEPDSLGNTITNQGIEFCAKATPVYEEGIAYAIANLQFDNVHLYIDAAHGGWLGWDGNLPLGKITVATSRSGQVSDSIPQLLQSSERLSACPETTPRSGDS